ncbi:hypothetical protein EVAR_70151_1 [Eumeta japonica]|uniref:Uncharacterized protein n=1 Tax=Eumeta variegata TaxID=151549 RepID=A0A4C2A8R6_EUMVA|nr:hypothetical protein EVAR_70151_1 [Eumeta japonica]
MTKDLMKRVTHACDASMPRKHNMNQRPAVHWWNDPVAALHHSWTSATSGLRGLFLITCRQTFLQGLFLITNFFVCEAPSGARPSAVANVADA